MAMEAMAQVAMALLETTEPPCFDQVAFERAIRVADGPVVIRIAALITEPGCCKVSIRSAETNFQVDHVRAYCRQGIREIAALARPAAYTQTSLTPDGDLYGGLLFHAGRFRRLRSYRHLRATECLAEIECRPSDWFGQFLPQTLALGDPGARDAAIHGIQSCVPQDSLLPVSIDRISASSISPANTVEAYARERLHDGDYFIYDLEIARPDGVVIERWEGLRLKRMRDSGARTNWSEGLLGPYIERRLEEINLNGRMPTVSTASRSLEHSHRLDGKPDARVSVSHGGGVSLVVSGSGPLGCDVEPVVRRGAQMWRDLLGIERFELADFIRAETQEDFDTAATRVWAACECLKKAGAGPAAPLLFAKSSNPGGIILRSGATEVMTMVEQVRSSAAPLVIGVLVSHAQEEAHIALARS